MKDKFSNLLSKLYQAASDSREWPAFLKAAGESVGAPYSALLTDQSTSQAANVIAFENYDPEMIAGYNGYYAPLDPWYPLAIARLEPGWVGDSRALVKYEELQRTEFYNDFFSRYQMQHNVIGIIAKDQRAMSTIALMREKRQRPFSEKEVGWVRALMPHLQCALDLHFRLGHLQMRTESAESAIHLLPFGVIFLRADQTISYTNATAEGMLRSRDGLCVSKNKVHATAPGHSAHLHAAISEASDLGLEDGRGVCPGAVLLLPRSGGKRPLHASVAPLRTNQAESAATGVAIFIQDPDALPCAPEQAWAVLYGLSTAECRLARHILDGRALNEIADVCHISRNTAKTELRSIFQKTRTSKQGQLVRLLLQVPSVQPPMK